MQIQRTFSIYMYLEIITNQVRRWQTRGRWKEIKSEGTKWHTHCENLINPHDFLVKNGCIRTRLVEQHMQQWKPMVQTDANYRLIGYNTSDNNHGGATVELYATYRNAVSSKG